MPEAQPALSEEKTIPLDDTGDPVNVEVKDDQVEEKKETVEETTPAVETQEKTQDDSTEHEEYSTNVKKRINDLTKKWREEERQKDAAIKFASNVKKENDKLQKEFSSLDESYVEEVAQKVDIAEAGLKRELAAAHQSQDFDKIADLQSQLADNAVQKQRVLLSKKRAEAKAKEVPAEPPKDFSKQSQTQTGPKPSQKAMDWANKNSWFGQGQGKDEVKTFATWGIHTQLINEGYNPESDDYYNEIDTRLLTHFPAKIDNTNSSSSTAGNRVVQTVAGATNARTGGKTGRRTVKLTPSQVAIAKKLGVPLDEYAKHVKE